MASNKKCPHTRRAKNNDLKYLYLTLDSDEEDAYNRKLSQTSALKTDQPDRVTTSISSAKPKKQKSASYDEGLYTADIDDSSPEQIHKEERRLYEGPRFDYLDVLVGFSSIAFFYFDVVTDIILARDYYKQGYTAPFVLTTAFVIGPALVTAGLNFRWYLLDYRSQEIHVKNHGKENVKRTSLFLWFIRFTMSFLLMSPVIR